MSAVRRVIIAALSATLLLVAVAAARPQTSAVDAPKFVAGPRITKAGMIWLSTSGPMLTNSAGISRRLASGPALPSSSPDSKWEARESRKGVLVGEIGGRLSNIAPLNRCPPLRATSTLRESTAAAPSSLLAISGARLFAIVDPICLRRHGYGHVAILSESLNSGSWQLLTSIPAGALSLAADGERLAVTYISNPATAGAEADETKVAVYDGRTGRRLFRVTATLAARQATPPSTTVDDLGDVLVTETTRRPPPSVLASSSWWATPASPHEHRLSELLTTETGALQTPPRTYQPYTADVALSAGRIAYAAYQHEGTDIDLRDLKTHRFRTLVHLRGEVKVLGLDLSAGEIAWAQQSQFREGHSETTLNGGERSECRTVVLGEPQVVSVGLRSLGASGLTVGKPLPTNLQPCPPER